MSRVYRGWIINPSNNGGYKATNDKKQTIIAKHLEWIEEEIDRREEANEDSKPESNGSK